jgi:4-amino-4-deoxy-L-arabinose transferase-like glycosyltransferase
LEHSPATWQSPNASTPDAAAPDRTAASHRARRTPRPRVPGSWPLLAVLAVQAALSARLARADTAFQDEALYLWAGHLEWAHLSHGTPLPQFPAYFSGAPVIYPPVAALADSLGGLTGARLLSLVFMLGATVALWATTSRLFGRRAAFFAAALFAVFGPTLHLGAFATFDAMATFLVALAAWLVVRAGERPDATGWMLAAGVALALADATSYPAILFDPVVILLALFAAFPTPGGRAAAARAGTLLAVVAVLATGALLIGGSRYLHGIETTTLARAPGSDPALAIIGHFWSWTGVIVIAAAIGVVIAWAGQPNRARTWLLTVVAAALVLVTPIRRVCTPPRR